MQYSAKRLRAIVTAGARVCEAPAGCARDRPAVAFDVPVNNAGIAGATVKVEDIRPEGWDRCINLSSIGGGARYQV